jgi:ABC-type transport system involved in multi-copper enzyme maturation permease subunit
VAAIAANAGEQGMGDESALGFGFFGMLPASICVITLGVLTIASEYGTGMIRTTLTACPSRARVLTAKAIVFFLLVFTVTTVVAALVGAVQVALVDAADTPTTGEWLRATVGAGGYLAMLGLLSLALGTLIRHSAGAITVMIGVLLLPLVAAMFMFSEALKSVQEWLFTYAIPSQMIALYAARPPFGDDGPSGWEPLLIMTGVAGVALAGAFSLLNSRDV